MMAWVYFIYAYNKLAWSLLAWIVGKVKKKAFF